MFRAVEFFVSQNGFTAFALRLFRPIILLNNNSENSVKTGQVEFGTAGAGTREGTKSSWNLYPNNPDARLVITLMAKRLKRSTPAQFATPLDSCVRATRRRR